MNELMNEIKALSQYRSDSEQKSSPFLAKNNFLNQF